MKIEYVKWNISHIGVVCEKCGKDFKIVPTTGEMEEHNAEWGEAKLDGVCPFCEFENKGVIELEDYSYAL